MLTTPSTRRTTSVPGTTVLTTTTSASSTTTTTPVVSPTMLTTPSTRRERELPPSPILDTVPATTSVSASVRPTAERVLASTARSRETTRMAPTVAPARTTASLALTTLATILSLAPAEDSVLRTNLLAAPTRDGPDTALMSTRADPVTPRRDSVTVSAKSAHTNSLSLLIADTGEHGEISNEAHKILMLSNKCVQYSL